jgi:TonB family protein
MSSNVSPGFGTTYLTGAIGAQSLSIALIGPDHGRRKAVAAAVAESGRTNVREFETFPIRSEEFRWLLEQSFDVIIFDLDSDPDVVLDLVERVRAANSATIMVYSERADTKLAVRYMRAGAREYLLLPLEDGVVAEALDRVKSNRIEAAQPAQRRAGNLFVFVCPKGGCGATTVACNLAVALAANSEQKTLLIDLALPIGDAALALGIAAQYSTEDAIRNAGRLDGNLLKELLVRHQSDLYVLAAPSNIPGIEGCEDAIDKLISVARREFDHVVVDVGSRMDLMETTLFRQASTVYLVTLSGISELRNSNRLISQFFSAGGPNLEVVINRFENRLLGGVREEDVAKALGRPVRWKVPEDMEAAREMQYGATGVGNTRISNLSQEMAAAITGRTASKEKKKGFSLKGPGRNAAEEDFGGDMLPGIKTAPPAPAPPAAPARSAPVIHWPAPAPIAYGDALSPNQLNARASVAGTLVYTPGPGTVLPVGTHNLSVSFTPADSENYTATQATVPIEVTIATPLIAWPRPDPIRYGTPLGAGQLCAAASVPGSFDYTPAPGEVLPAGTHELSVSFTPADSENYASAQATVLLEVEKAIPVIAWPKPDPIPCGTPLDARQLRATASASGRFDYSPASGEVLPAGRHKLTVTFTPADSRNYATAQATVPLDVEKATPLVAWAKPAPITCGTPLGDAQLNAKASVAGTLVYTPEPGTVLPAGRHKLTVTFTPDDSANCATVQATVPLDVEKLTPVIAWANPEPIPFGTALGAGQLNARASVAGTLVYKPGPGAALPAGRHKLSVTFTPADSENYTTAQATVPLDVEKAAPVIAWSKPDPIPYGTPLGAGQLCASASVRGRFEYTPAPGEVLPVGAHTLSVTFIPADGENYTTAQATVPLDVEKATPVIAWPKPDPMQYGTPLGTNQLCAAASVQGKFEYAPALGEVLPAGANKLTATFIPADSANYSPVQTTVSLEVTKAVPSIAWPAPHSIHCDTALSSVQLCASSPVPGKFEYNPGPGQTLPVGTHTLSVTFTPADSANYSAARATVSIKVLDKPAAAVAWTSPEPKAAVETHAFSEAFHANDSASYAAARSADSLHADKPAHAERSAARADKPAYADKPAAHVEKPGTHIEWPTPQPMKHGKPLRDSDLDSPASPVSTTGTFREAAAQTRTAAPRVTPFPADTEKYKAAQTKTETPVDSSRDALKQPAASTFQEVTEPAQKPGGAWQQRQADNKPAEVSTDIDWLNFHNEILPEPAPSGSKLGEIWSSAKKKWIFAGAGAGAVLLVSILAVMHSRAMVQARGAVAPPPVAASTQFDSGEPKPSPQEPAVQDQAAPAAQAMNAAPAQSGPTSAQKDNAQADNGQAQTDSAPAQSGPTSEQAEMMHDQLSAPSRIAQEMQKQVAVNAPPPPSNFSAASASGLGGSSNIGNVFGGKAPSVVAAAPRGPLAISASVAMGLLTQKTAPVYPEIAKKARVSGTVQLEATISKTGRIEELHVLSGPIMLQGAAMEAVRTWRYRPYMVNNQPIEVKTTIFVAFSLGE